MIVILAIDALEYDKVEEYACDRLKQAHYGKTDISEFTQPRTMVLWSSFMTGENKEDEVLVDGDKEMWNKRWDIEDTFFSRFENPAVLDLPGFSYDLAAHERSRALLKEFFDAEDRAGKQSLRARYNADAFAHHQKVKEAFLQALHQMHDLVLGYFSLVDVIGHLNFGNATMMRMLYREMEEIYEEVAQASEADRILVLSDHGMKAIGQFGDHSEHGFWSTSWDAGLSRPRITDFYRLLSPQ